MPQSLLLPICWAGFALFTAIASAQNPKSTAPVSEINLDWIDSTRNRQVPVRIYLPAKSAEVCPVIVFSHGLGGSRDGYAYLGQYWAGQGFVSVHLQHLGSDEAILKGSKSPLKNLRKALLDPDNALNRTRDVSFAIDQLTRLNEDKSSALYRRLDLKHIGVSGHSFGAYTTLAVAGGILNGSSTPSSNLVDPRVSAAVEMSAPPLRAGVDPRKAYGSIKIPCLHITGTDDTTSPLLSFGEASGAAKDRRVAYDFIPGPNQYLIIYQDADHMVFSGAQRRAPLPQDSAIRASVCEMTTAFWKAWLGNDSHAKQWLGSGDAPKSLGKLAGMETK